ncbi:sialic acid-binding Ig-like lectin 14 [Anabas testudineus]|uniref:sialic acid-binding Ig-like lectin 14 n=1 Tax=Anabas testudineus TaxID=64144 RepID=UPI000E462778|nr:sialic acid-binding Ig-like lectin 14 [Anabas testudineus]
MRSQCTVVVKIKHCQTGSYCITLPEREITAEAGLCVVLPCSFTNDAVFNVTGFIWYKCDSSTKQRCDMSAAGKLIFNSSSNENVQPEFRGRVSLLETNVTKKNCSIIINDLRKSDSGSYELRLVGNKDGKTDGFTFISKATITITDLSQTPTVVIHPLTEGQHITLTCTAPGLCSGSVPNITWMWRKQGESHITGNSIGLRTENLTAIRQRHSSTLTFDGSVTQSGTKVTCKVTFTGNINTEESLSVAIFPKILKSSACVIQSEILTCVCVSEGFPIPTITWPLVKDHNKYSVTSTVSNHTVHNTITLTVKHHTSTVAECVSSNGNVYVKQNLTITTSGSDVETDVVAHHGPSPVIFCDHCCCISHCKCHLHNLLLVPLELKTKGETRSRGQTSQITAGNRRFIIVCERRQASGITSFMECVKI